MPAFDFQGKTLRVVRNDDPGAEVNEDTVFHFQQEGDVVHADYLGGQVKVGKVNAYDVMLWDGHRLHQ